MSALQAVSAPPSITKTVSLEVRVLLARRELPASALAPVLGITTQAVSKKMRGVASWSLDDLNVLAHFFGVDANALLPSLGTQGVGGADAGSVLPHLDSNQEPAGQHNMQVRGRFSRSETRVRRSHLYLLGKDSASPAATQGDDLAWTA